MALNVDTFSKLAGPKKEDELTVNVYDQIRENQCSKCRYRESCVLDSYYCPAVVKLAEMSF